MIVLTCHDLVMQFSATQVTKAPEEQIAQAMSAAGPVPSALRVTVPPELQGVAFISVLCQKGTLNHWFLL